MEKDRYKLAVELQKFNNTSVLDCGCRDKILKSYFSNKEVINYQGIDFYEDVDVVKHNLEEGIPFDDASFDVVFGLDVIEHVENIHFLLNEMLRVSKNEVIIALPNMYHYSYRIKYLFGDEISTKFELPTEKILDRHRWLTFYKQNKRLVEKIFSNYKITEVNQPQTHNRIKILNFIDKLLINKYPNLFSFTNFYAIEKNTND
jgi:ubiquinone/menaquinone biosynthesis C-methylase UbiE